MLHDCVRVHSHADGAMAELMWSQSGKRCEAGAGVFALLPATLSFLRGEGTLVAAQGDCMCMDIYLPHVLS